MNAAIRFRRIRVFVLATAAAALLVLGSCLASAPAEGAGSPVDRGARAMLFQ